MIKAIRGLKHLTPVTELLFFLAFYDPTRRFFPTSQVLPFHWTRRLVKGKLQICDGLIRDKVTALETLKKKLMEPMC